MSATAKPEASSLQPFLPYWRRSLVVVALAAIAGPVLGTVVLATVGPVADMLNGQLPSFEAFRRDFAAGLGLGFSVGGPLSIVAGLLIGWQVGRRGNISYGATVLISFLVPIILGFPLMGAFTIFAPLLGVAAALIAVLVQWVTGLTAKHVLGMKL